MFIRPFARPIVIAFAIAAAAFAAAAQDVPVNTLRITEANLNASLAASRTERGALTVDLQAGQAVLNLTLVDRNGRTNTASLTVVPVVANGALDFNATALTINGASFSTTGNATVDETTADVNALIGGDIDGAVQSAVLTDTDLTVTWLNADPAAPTVTIDDTLWSLNFTEAGLNALPWVTSPTDPLTTALSVDVQDGRVLVTATRTAEPTSITYIITPVVVNNRVRWNVEAENASNGSLPVTYLTSWRAYVDATVGDTRLVNATASAADGLTFTWDTAAEAQPANSEVTYTFSETETNQLFAALAAPGDTLAVDFQAGQAVIAVNTVSEGQPVSLLLTIEPVVSEGKLLWPARAITINGLEVTVTDSQAALAIAAELAQGLNGRANPGTVISAELTDSQLTVTVRYN